MWTPGLCGTCKNFGSAHGADSGKRRVEKEGISIPIWPTCTPVYTFRHVYHWQKLKNPVYLYSTLPHQPRLAPPSHPGSIFFFQLSASPPLLSHLYHCLFTLNFPRFTPSLASLTVPFPLIFPPSFLPVVEGMLGFWHSKHFCPSCSPLLPSDHAFL